MIHTTLPTTDHMPASRRQVVVRPNGQRTKLAKRREAMPKGDRDDEYECQHAGYHVAGGKPESGEHQPQGVAYRLHKAHPSRFTASVKAAKAKYVGRPARLLACRSTLG
jgi:hypothetical protein